MHYQGENDIQRVTKAKPLRVDGFVIDGNCAACEIQLNSGDLDGISAVAEIMSFTFLDEEGFEERFAQVCASGMITVYPRGTTIEQALAQLKGWNEDISNSWKRARLAKVVISIQTAVVQGESEKCESCNNICKLDESSTFPRECRMVCEQSWHYKP